MNREITAKDIAFDVLKQVAIAGMKAGRYIYVDTWRNQLIDISSQKLGVEVNNSLRQEVEQELKQAWQVILNDAHSTK
ncbi:hypothetical protein [Coleofasciculus sp. FACHB-501]|uniref:hypothetical protein n=1 Tax=Cyanophyceae TaxID=3028117 RepID=UPI0016845A0D|nr:hypothetical protein [Coleofasciculus sp. FACHB-501]MBD1836641.1 hypothetical protein [Coleofasciculus sp. FACHB-501]